MLELHLLLELFAVVVAILIAVVSWHDLENRRSAESGILLAGFLVVAFLDLVHALTYDGMPALVTASSTPRAICFWLAGRTLVLRSCCWWCCACLWCSRARRGLRLQRWARS